MKILNGITLTGNASIDANSLTVGTNQLVAKNGRIGVGTTSPSQLFSVGGTSDLNGIIIDGAQIYTPGANLKLISGGPQSDRNNIFLINNGGIIIDGGSSEASGVQIKGGGGNVRVTQGILQVDTGSALNTITSYFTTGNHDGGFRLGFANGSGASLNTEQGALVFTYGGTRIGSIGFNRGGSANCDAITFSTSLNNERMRIDINGNVGIGVTNPTARLQISGATTTLNIAAGSSGQLILNDPSAIYANELYPYRLNYTGVNSVGLHNKTIKNLSGIDDEHVAFLNETEVTATADSTGEGITASYNTAFVKRNAGQIGTVTAGSFQVNTSQGTGATVNLLQGLSGVAQHLGASAGPNSYVTTVTGINGSAQIQTGTGSTSTLITSDAYGGNFIANVLMSSTFSGAGVSVLNMRGARTNIITSGATVSNTMSLESLVQVGTQSLERANSNIVNAVGISLGAIFGRSGSTYSTAITNYYGLYMAGASINSNATITNKYGIYQVDTGFTNYFASSIGIGATTSISSKLQIYENTSSGNTTEMLRFAWQDNNWGMKIDQIHTGSAIDYAFRIRNQGATYNELLYMKPTGRIGIGNISPAVELHITDSNPEILRLERTGGFGNAAIGVSSSGSMVFFGKPNIGNFAVGASFDLTSSPYLTIGSNGNVGIATGSTPSYKLDVKSGTASFEGTSGVEAIRVAGAAGSWFWIDNPTTTRLRFSSGATAGTNPMIFEDNGYLGLGVNPSDRLHIKGVQRIESSNAPTGNHAKLQLNATASVDYGLLIEHINNSVTDASIQIGGKDTVGNIGFATNTSGNAATTRMTITSTGNVGIGTAGPAAKLDVVGEVRTSSRFGYGASAYTQYNSTTKSIDFIFA